MTDPLRLAERYQSIADMPGDLFDFPPDAEQRQRFRLIAAALRLAEVVRESAADDVCSWCPSCGGTTKIEEGDSFPCFATTENPIIHKADCSWAAYCAARGER